MLQRLFSIPLYTQIWRQRIRVSCPKRPATFDDRAALAVHKASQKIVSVGSKTQYQTGSVIIEPFSHPRVAIHEFDAASKLLAHAFSTVMGKSLLQPKPTAVIHLMESYNGGITDIERRAFREAAFVAGARDCYFWEGEPLTEQEMLQGVYKNGA